MPLNPDSPLARLMATLPRAGKVEWIGLRPARDEAMIATGTVEAIAGAGLVGDRYKSGSGKRGITLIQAEHLPAIAALAQRPDLTPALLRRNVVVSGIPLIALKQRRFRIGTAVFEGTEECDPCSRMEDALRRFAEMPRDTRRMLGLVALAAGVALVWLARSLGA